MSEARTAVVVGATGVVGRHLMRHLCDIGGWRVVGLSRREPELPPGAEWIGADLLDAGQARDKLAPLGDATHLFYGGLVDAPNVATNVGPNLALLVNAVEGLEAAAPGLQHVSLIEGTKWYGSHLGPFKTPAREDDPRHMPPNFYYDQQDWLAARQAGSSWTWSALRPHAICGFALGNPMNLTTAIAVYAAISKELGLPLRFPGKPRAFETLYQASDSALLAKAMVWAATTPQAANQAFNMTNGDVFRWRDLWPAFAVFFDMPVGPPQQIDLTAMMADKAPVWQRIAERHGLQNIPYEDLVRWPFADFVFASDWDIVSDMGKARRAGFHEVEDSQEMFLRLFGEFREEKVIP